ncbi:MAG: hypothetical protein ACD_58C00017G0007 [uncultured bacterium]|nr:MAG: hypothetical protein ACD_58C00017G0007 [uncultured bacterium]
MTLNQRALASRIARLRQFIKAIDRLKVIYDRKTFLSEEDTQRLIERYLQLALEAVLDISDQIIAQEGLRKPEEYKDNILILAEKNIIPKQFALDFSKSAGFRNILVHAYLEIDPKKVYQHFQEDSDDIKIFLKHIVKYFGLGNKV